MATYKLIQDIEAEDKILGPLTLRQFIFGLVGAFFVYLSFFAVTKGIPFLLIIFLPPALFCILFAFPFGRDQPTEIWLLAKIKFWFFPRKRIWNQSGVKELVTITVPKKIEKVLTDGLSQSEVKSRLQTLANTIDSRGWAIKNIDATYAQPMIVSAGASSDRLIDLDNIFPSAQGSAISTDDADDMLDPDTSPIAHKVDELVKQASATHRQQLVDQLNSASPPPEPEQAGGWFMNQSAASGSRSTPVKQASTPLAPTVVSTTPIMPQPVVSTAMPGEDVLSAQLRSQSEAQHIAYGHLRTLNPTNSTHVPQSRHFQNKKTLPQTPSTEDKAGLNPAILELAGNDDLNVSTLAREANKADHASNESDEIIIPLH